MIHPDHRERVSPVRFWRRLLDDARGPYAGAGMEKFLVFVLGAVAAGWFGVTAFGMNALVVPLFAGVVGYAFVRWVIWLVETIRSRWPGFLSRGSEYVPRSRLRLVTAIFANILNRLLVLTLILMCVGFLAGLPPMVIWGITEQRWATLWIGLPLAPLMVWGFYKIVQVSPSHRVQPLRPSTPTDRGHGDLREYEVRFGWHRATLIGVAGCVGFLLVGLSAWRDAPWLALMCTVVFGGAIVWQVLGALMHNVAIRVGAAGVVLGKHPVRGTVEFVPWSEIEAVVVSEVENGSKKTGRIGVQRRPEVPPLFPPRPRRLSDGEEVPYPPLVRDAPASSVSAAAWHLDVDRLAKAIELNAPQVVLVDLRR